MEKRQKFGQQLAEAELQARNARTLPTSMEVQQRERGADDSMQIANIVCLWILVKLQNVLTSYSLPAAVN